MKINTMIYSQTVTFTRPHFQPHLKGASFLGTASKVNKLPTKTNFLVCLFSFQLLEAELEG